jgi:hypothetical protein
MKIRNLIEHLLDIYKTKGDLIVTVGFYSDENGCSDNHSLDEILYDDEAVNLLTGDEK